MGRIEGILGGWGAPASSASTAAWALLQDTGFGTRRKHCKWLGKCSRATIGAPSSLKLLSRVSSRAKQAQT